MTLLAIDTSTDFAGICLFDRSVRHEVNWRSGRNHTSEVAERIARILRDERLEPHDLGGIAVAIGPGSFSGVRVGVALAKAMSLSLALPLVGVPTLDAIAYGYAWFPGLVRPIIDGGRGQVATASYRCGDGAAVAVSGAALADLRDLLPVSEPTLFCGEVSPAQSELIRSHDGPAARIFRATRRAVHVAELAMTRIEQGILDDPLGLQPVYLRRPAVLDRLPISDEMAQLRSITCPT